MHVRPTKPEDIPDLASVAEAAGLFPGELLPEMAVGLLSGAAVQDIWLTCEWEGQAVGFCFAIAEKLTDGTWNMLALAVHPSQQGRGVGAAIVRRLEATLSERGQRILIVDTSGAESFARTREFYKKNGYSDEARIRDFWSAGVDKIVLWKRLS